MDTAMSDEWKDKYFDEKFKNLASSITSIHREVQTNTKLTQQVKEQASEIGSRVIKLEGAVFPEEKLQKKDLPPFYRDPKTIQVFLYLSLALLLLVAAATRYDVGKLL